MRQLPAGLKWRTARVPMTNGSLSTHRWAVTVPKAVHCLTPLASKHLSPLTYYPMGQTLFVCVLSGAEALTVFMIMQETQNGKSARVQNLTRLCCMYKRESIYILTFFVNFGYSRLNSLVWFFLYILLTVVTYSLMLYTNLSLNDSLTKQNPF